MNNSCYLLALLFISLICVHGYIPSPLFSATFSQDPTAHEKRNYKWILYDPEDSPEQQDIHNGIVVLNRTSNMNYVNLSASDGLQSIGYILPNIGGMGRGNITRQTAGWSFEGTYKIWNSLPWMKIFDLGNGPLIICQWW